MKDLAIVVYSHTDYKDAWPIFFGQADKYLREYKKYIFVDKNHEDIPDGYNICLYDDSKIYRERVLSCLEKVKEDFIIFHHEDMFLFAEPDMKRIESWTEVLDDLEFPSVKLLKGGVLSDDIKHECGDPYLNKTPKSAEYVFAIQPTLWDVDEFQEIHEGCQGETIWEFETKAQQFCKLHKLIGLYSHNQEPLRGTMHYDSDVYPFIATAIVKGKWNSEYRKELTVLFEEYNIDASLRGWT